MLERVTTIFVKMCTSLQILCENFGVAKRMTKEKTSILRSFQACESHIDFTTPKMKLERRFRRNKVRGSKKI